MSNPVAFAVVDSERLVTPPMASVSLKGTTRGLEIQVASAVSADALAERLSELLAEAPGFFAGSDARVTFDGVLPSGALSCLEAVAAKFELKLIEVAPAIRPQRSYAAVVRRVDEVRRSKLAEGSGPVSPNLQPVPVEAAPVVVVEAAAPAVVVEAAAPAVVVEAAPAVVVEAAPVVVVEVAEVDAAPVADDAAPIEVALANTAPYFVDAIAADVSRAEAQAIEAELAIATPLFVDDEDDDAPEIVVEAAAPDPAVLAAATAMAEDLALSMAGELIETKSRALAEQLAQDLAAKLAEELAQAKAHQLADELAEAKAQKLFEARAAELASQLADELAEIRAARLAEERAPLLAAVLAEQLAEAKASEILAAMPVSPRLVIGPVRSGVIVDHAGHVVVIGDVNPGAEVRANGSIIVLGRLRGVAHAAIGREAGAIIALSFQPQQLRIGRMVARAGAGDRPSDGAEIAYLTGETIVVERFLGRLPSGLAASM